MHVFVLERCDRCLFVLERCYRWLYQRGITCVCIREV